MITKIAYCKRGYFRWGTISRNWLQDISRGGNFHDTNISFIKAYVFYIRVGVIFAKKTKARKTRKFPSTRNFPRLQYLKQITLCRILDFDDSFQKCCS